LWHAGIQARIEVAQKMSHAGDLERVFRGIIKVGDKADARIEEEVALDPAVFAQRGFLRAFKEGMKTEGRQEEYQALKVSMAEALGIQEYSASEYQIYPVLYLRADTKKTLYSPQDDAGTVLELKTDDVYWETVLQQTGHLTQIEIELQYDGGNPALVDREIRSLTAHFNFLALSSVSKPAAGMEALAQYLRPRDASDGEIQRTRYNRAALRPYLHSDQFCAQKPADLGLVALTPAGPV
jgi:hypothetical protein